MKENFKEQTVQNTNAANANTAMGIPVNRIPTGESASKSRPLNISQNVRPDGESVGCFQQGYGCPKVKIANGFPVVNGGGLTEGEVHLDILANLNHIQNCYDQFLRRAPDAAGTMGATFVIDAGGRVNSLKARFDTLNDSKMLSCVTRKIQSWAFPRPRGNSSPTVVVKFAFEEIPSQSVGFNNQQVQILVGGGVSPQYFAKGSAQKRYVEAQEGKEYSIRVTNPYGVRVAVAVAVDGFNAIDASHSTASQSKKWIIAPFQSITVSGWQVASDRLRKFVFATEEGSYGAKLGKTNDLGNISIALFRERTPTNALQGADYGRSSSFSSASGNKLMNRANGRRADIFQAATGGTAGEQGCCGRAGNTSSLGIGASIATVVQDKPAAKSSSRYAATAMGNSQQNNISFVNIDLESTPVMEMSIRYEYREVLVKMGILPAQALTSEETLHRRERGQGFQNVSYSPEVQ